MRNYLCIFLFFLLVVLSPHPAYAIKIKIFDIATKAEDVVEKLTELKKKVEEQIDKVNSKIQNSKLGKMGKDAHKLYSDLKPTLIKSRNLAGLKVPSYFADITSSVDSIYKEVEDNFVLKYLNSNDSKVKQEQERHNMEIQHNLIADVYAKSYALRNTLIKERQEEKKEVKPENTRELIETGRAYNEKILQRYIDVLNLEATLLDFENTRVLMIADPVRLQRAEGEE